MTAKKDPFAPDERGGTPILMSAAACLFHLLRAGLSTTDAKLAQVRLLQAVELAAVLDMDEVKRMMATLEIDTPEIDGQIEARDEGYATSFDLGDGVEEVCVIYSGRLLGAL